MFSLSGAVEIFSRAVFSYPNRYFTENSRWVPLISDLDYASQVWSPHQAYLSDMVEAVPEAVQTLGD